MLAWAVIEGKFTGYAAPCYAHHNTRDVYGRIRVIARDCAFEELPAFDDFDARWRAGYERWRRLRAAVSACPGFVPDDGPAVDAENDDAIWV